MKTRGSSFIRRRRRAAFSRGDVGIEGRRVGLHSLGEGEGRPSPPVMKVKKEDEWVFIHLMEVLIWQCWKLRGWRYIMA